jgi:hypothetical protein
MIPATREEFAETAPQFVGPSRLAGNLDVEAGQVVA